MKYQKYKLYRALSCISLVTSSLFSITTAYIDDFHPTLNGFHALFMVKAIISTLFWMAVTVTWFNCHNERRFDS